MAKQVNCEHSEGKYKEVAHMILNLEILWMESKKMQKEQQAVDILCVKLNF